MNNKIHIYYIMLVGRVLLSCIFIFVQEITKKLFDGYGYGHLLPAQDIPDFMKKLTSIGRENEYKGMKFRKTLRQVERQLKRVNAQGLKIAYKEIKDAVEEGNEKRIQKAIYVATQERTRYFARRIARTEMARAYGDGVMAEWADDEDCVAFKWHTSSGHPFCDICDLYGNADLYGMGKGVYPKDKVPRLPVHPNCMCHLQPLMDGSSLLKGKERDQVEQGGMDYIQGLKKHDQETLLGVGGRKEVLRKGDWRTYARGYSDEVMIKPVIKEFQKPEKLIIAKEKLTGYCLNKTHEKGRDKAVAFEKYLGYTEKNYRELEALIRDNIPKAKITERNPDQYGRNFNVEFYVKVLTGKKILLVTGWKYGKEDSYPRLTSAYLKPEKVK